MAEYARSSSSYIPHQSIISARSVAARFLFQNLRTLNGGYKTVILKKKCYWVVRQAMPYRTVTFFFEFGKITFQKHQVRLRAPKLPHLQRSFGSRAVVGVWCNTISTVPAEHDQPLVTARLNSSLGCERHVRTWVEVKVHLAYLGGGDEVRLTCHGWLKLGLVINLIFVVIRLLVWASLRASLDDSMLNQQQGWLRSFSTSWFLTVNKGMG